MYRNLSNRWNSQNFTMQSQISQKLYRSMVTCPKNMSYVQDGHTQALWIDSWRGNLSGRPRRNYVQYSMRWFHGKNKNITKKQKRRHWKCMCLYVYLPRIKAVTIKKIALNFCSCYNLSDFCDKFVIPIVNF